MSTVEKCACCGHVYGGAGTAQLLCCPNCGAARTGGSMVQAYPYASPAGAQAYDLRPKALGLSASSLAQMSTETAVAGPATLLMMWGGISLLLGTSLILLGVVGVASGTARDPFEAIVLFGTLGGFQAVSGGVVLAGGVYLRRLRAYGLVLGAILFGMISSFFLCLPLSLLGIWPLMVALDPRVKRQFT